MDATADRDVFEICIAIWCRKRGRSHRHSSFGHITTQRTRKVRCCSSIVNDLVDLLIETSKRRRPIDETPLADGSGWGCQSQAGQAGHDERGAHDGRRYEVMREENASSDHATETDHASNANDQRNRKGNGKTPDHKTATVKSSNSNGEMNRNSQITRHQR